MKHKYHHGDLANSLVTATVSLLQTRGVAQLSLREVARAAGVSHGAPAHHFGDKAGLLTAVAIQGYRLLAAQLMESQTLPGRTREQRLLDAGFAYIQFALSQTAYFTVMFQPALTRGDKAHVQHLRLRVRHRERHRQPHGRRTLRTGVHSMQEEV